MMIEVLKSKIHCARVTEANLNYMGSITIDEDLLDAANMIAGEKVYIADNNNGERFETYIIKGERGSGKICLNGAAARKVQPDDIVIIMSYALMDFEEAKSFKPTVIFPDPDTNTVGIFSRMAAISIPGVILSQLLMHTIASALWALTIYSTLSAMISRLGSE